LEFSKIPFIMPSYCQEGGIEYEDIGSDSKGSIAGSGGFD
jgi:hypothetical protein